MLQAYFFRPYSTYIWKVPKKIRTLRIIGPVLIIGPVHIIGTLEYPPIKFEEKFQPTLLLEPPLVLET